MFTQCPECQTLYALDTATLAQAEGRIGCGHCGATFNALAALVETLPEAPFDILPVHPTSPAPPILMLAVTPAEIAREATSVTPPAAAETLLADDAPAASASPDPAAAPTAQPDAADHSADADLADWFAALDNRTTAPAPVVDPAIDPAAIPVDETPAEPATSVPSFARHRRVPLSTRQRRWWAAACAVLALALGAQLVYAERMPLTADATTRPWLATACRWFGCRLPAVRDTASLQLLSRDVRPHPSVPGALLISATVRNNAAFTQPYPVVSITLSDLNGNRIAMRRFRPDEYIASAGVRAAGLAPGQTAALMFEVKDPGRNAVAFQFGFQ